MWKTQQLLDSRMWRFLLLTPGGRHSQDPSKTSKSMWKVKHNPTPRIPLSVRCFTRHHFMCECVKWNGDFQPWWLFLQKLCGIQGKNCPNWSFLGPPGEPRGHFHGLPTHHLRYEIQCSTHLRCLEPLMVIMALSDQSRPFWGFNFEGAYSKTVLCLIFSHLCDIYRKYPANINLFPKITFTQNVNVGGNGMYIYCICCIWVKLPWTYIFPKNCHFFCNFDTFF